VELSETLARFVLYSNRVRADGTLKPDLFIPHPYPDLSVTRHIGLSGPSIWQIGRMIAQSGRKPLYGRGDLEASAFVDHKLIVVADNPPDPANPNHANIRGWPGEKASQKILAQQISALATYTPAPPNSQGM